MLAWMMGFRPGLAAALSVLVSAAPVLAGGGPRPGPVAAARKAHRPPQAPPPAPLQATEDPHAPDRIRARLRARLRARQEARAKAGAAQEGRPAPPAEAAWTAPDIRLPFDRQPVPPAYRASLRPQHPGLADWIRFLFLLLALSDLLPVTGGEFLHPEPPRLGPEAGFQAPPAPGPGGPQAAPGTARSGQAPAGTAGAGPAPPRAGGASGPGGPGLPALVQSHVHYVANQTAAFNQTVARVLPRQTPDHPATRPPSAPETAPATSPDPPPQAPPPVATPYLAQAAALARNISSPHGTGAAPASLAELGSRLALARQWVAQELDQSRTLPGPSAPPGLPAAMTAQLVALDGLSAGLQAILAGYQTGIVSPAVALGLIRQASDSIINVVNSFRVVAQSTALTAYPPRLEQIRSEMGQVLDRLLADPEPDRRDGSGQGLADPESLAPAQQEQACCDYADLQAQFTIQGILGAGGATNVAAYTVATEAAGEEVGVDFLRSGNATLTPAARALLAATDLTAVSAIALGSEFLVPPSGAVPSAPFPGPGAALDPPAQGNASSALAARCGGVRCDRPITAIRARVAGETLAGSILNLVGFIFYSVAVQLDIAMKVEHGGLVQVQVPGPAPGRSALWFETLQQNFRAQALETLPLRNLTALLDAVPAVPAAAPAFPGIRAGLDEAQVLRSVLQTAVRTLHQEDGPTLAGLAPGSVPPALWMADFLARFHELAASGAAQRGLAAAGAGNPAVDTRWQVLDNLATYSRYASAVADGWRSGALGRSSALALLGDLADTLQTLVYGWLIEASAVPLEVALLYRAGAVPHLAQARARALGLRSPPGAGDRRCRDWCHYVDLRTQAATETTARTATRIYLAAYIEALTGSIITQAVDAVDAFSPAARNGTWGAPAGGATTAPGGQVQAESVSTGDAAAAQAGTAAAAPVRSPLDPAALETLLADDPGPTSRTDEREAVLAAVCATAPCDESFSRQQTGLAEETRSGSELTFLAYTLNLVVKGFRIALAAGR